MLDLEPLIRQRLIDTVPALAGVHGAVSLGPEDVGGKKLPAAFVVSDGHKVLEVTGFGKTARIASRWLVVVAVRNVQQVAHGEAARADAADLVLACLKALMGWQPRAGVQTMQPVTPPAPVYQDGLLLYPMAFEVGEVIQGAES
jgi:hypothetical protein